MNTEHSNLTPFPIPLSTELLLVGSNGLTINQNTEIFLSVIQSGFDTLIEGQFVVLSGRRFQDRTVCEVKNILHIKWFEL
jgi:hypothetical protein